MIKILLELFTESVKNVSLSDINRDIFYGPDKFLNLNFLRFYRKSASEQKFLSFLRIINLIKSFIDFPLLIRSRLAALTSDVAKRD
jgi:hypothetical protein